MCMMLYSGTPGSYKSYHATYDIVKWLGRGKDVISNYPVDVSNFYKHKKKLGNFTFIDNDKLTPDYLRRYAKEHHKRSYNAQTLVVIDEASIMFNAREFSRTDRMLWIKFFANHRHYNFDIILIAQNDRMIDRQVRSLLEYEIKHRALKHWNLAFALLSLVCNGIFHCVEYWYPTKIKTDTQLRKFNQRIANCYDTLALFNLEDTIDEADAKGANIKIDTKKVRQYINRVS